MRHILSRKILQALIIEEDETAKRYFQLGLKYNIPELIEASRDEAKHRDLFVRLLNSQRY